MPSSRPRKHRLLPSVVLILTALALVLATTAWLSVRSGERDQLLRDHLESQQVLAEAGAAGVAAILDGFASDLDRLSRLPSVRYLDRPDRLVRTLESFLERTSVPTRALIRVDTAGQVLFVHPEDGLAEDEVVAVLRERAVLGVAGSYDSTTATDYEHCGCKYEDPRQEELSHLSYEWTRANVSPDAKGWLGGFRSGSISDRLAATRAAPG